MLTRLCLVVATLMLLLSVWGCGGSGSSTGGGGGGGGGGTITDAQRSKALTDIQAAYSKLPRMDRAADSQTLLQYLKTRPEISSAAISDDLSVWGWFADGQPICLVNNEPYLNYTRAASLPHSAALTSRSNPVGIPGVKAKLIQSFGVLDALFEDPRDDIEPMLKQAGYTVDSPHLAPTNLSDYRNLGPIDILFTNTHGGLGYARTGPSVPFWLHYCMFTDQKINDLLDPLNGTLQDDLKYAPAANGQAERRPRVVRILCDISWIIGPKGPLTPVNEWHYAITGEFVRKYMTFNNNSVWINNACHGLDPNGDFDIASFEAACYSKNLSTYVAWDGACDRQQANNSSRFLFDRLTGTNKFAAQNPPQRPFWFSSAYSEMDSTARPVQPGDPPSLTYTKARSDKGVVRLSIEQNRSLSSSQSSFGILRPTISGFQIEHAGGGKHQLRLAGDFGNAEDSSNRQVTVGGNAVNVLSWRWNEVLTDISATAGGDIVVMVDGRKSNAAPITIWRTTVTSRTEQTSSSKYTLVTANLVLRGRAWVARAGSGAPTFLPDGTGTVAAAIPGSTVTYVAGGSDDQSTSWSGSGTIALDEDLKFTDPTNTSGGYFATLTIDPPTRKMEIFLRLYKPDAFTITYKEGPTGKGDVGEPDAPIKPTMTGVVNGTAGTNTLSPVGTGSKNTVTWSAVIASNVPTSTTERSAR